MPTSVPPLQVHPSSPSEPAMLSSSAQTTSKPSSSSSLPSLPPSSSLSSLDTIPSHVIERPGGSLSVKYHSDGEDSDEEEVVPADRVGVILADKDARITHVNDFFSTLTGYSREESIGKNCSFLQGPATSRDAIKTIRECLKHNQPCRVALINYRKDGRVFWNLLFISPVFNNTGGLDSYVGIQMNRQAEFVDRPSPLFMWTRHRPRQGVISHLPHSSCASASSNPSASTALTHRASSTPPALPAHSSALLACPTASAEGQRTTDSPSATPRPSSAAEGTLSAASPSDTACSHSSCDCGSASPRTTSSSSSSSSLVQPQPQPQSLAPAVPADSPVEESALATVPDRTPVSKPPISFIAETLLPTKKGAFRVLAFKDQLSGSEIMCVAAGAVEGTSSLPVRVHDQCFTAEVFGSLKCDCKEQLDYAMEYIQTKGLGMVIYLQQEGRGIGLANKIKAYSLQERGYDTVEANTVLGFGAEERQYAVVLSVLDALNISSIRLLTNNPMKVQTLQGLGVNVTGRVPVLIDSNPHSAKYLYVKQHSMGHMLQ